MNKILGLLFASLFVTTLQAAQVIEVKVDEDANGYRDVALSYHNLYRSEKGIIEPLRLDDHLNFLALEHAVKLAREGRLSTSGAYAQNLWSYRGLLRTLAENAQNAVSSWYHRIEPAGGKSLSLVDHQVLYSDKIKLLGFGMSTFNDYTVVVAYYQ